MLYLQVDEGGETALTGNEIEVTDPDTAIENLVIEIDSEPSFGKIVDVAPSKLIFIYLHFGSNPLMNLLIFATVHSLMNNTNLIDSCQAHFPVQYTSNIDLICQK